MVLEAIGPAGLSISTVGLGDPEQDLAEKSAVDIEGLKFLAENAGGVYAYANDLESLTAVYQSYAASYQSEYQLTYTSPSALRDGVNRALTVRLIDAPPAAGEQEALVYNPGGLVPEVSQPIPLTLFLALVAGLVALLFVPGVINLVLKATKKAPSKGKPAGKEKPQPRIKLKD